MIKTFVIGVLLQLPSPVLAGSVEMQQGEPVELRAAQIESARTDKETNLRPEAEPKLQHDLKWLRSTSPYKLLTKQFHGIGLGIGQSGAGAGFAIGPQYSRSGLLSGKLGLKINARGSPNRSYYGGANVSLRDLWGGHVLLDFEAARRSITETPYYGSGSGSQKSGRSDYRLEDTTVELRPTFVPVRHVRAGLAGAYVKTDIGPGHSSVYISTERQYTPETSPGLDRQTEFWRGGGFLEYDWRDRDWAPTSGGKYSAKYIRYLDRNLDSFSFLRLDFDAAQYVPLFNHTRVIALHGATSLTQTNGTQVVPFYLQPRLGGADTLRGYRTFRFSGDNSVLANLEYRWEVSPTASFTAFADAGKVFDRWSQWNLHNAQSDVGFAFAIRTESKVAFRIDTGFSHEGVQIWFRANNMF